MKYKNRTGIRYGHLVALRDAGRNCRHQVNWLCLCDCGMETVVFGGNLESGHTISCGCKKGLFKHGENKTGKRSAEYQTLAGMISRCTNPNSVEYYNYGGRGIKVYEGWTLANVQAFIDHVGRRPSAKHSIDRWPNKDGNYEPGNVRWATAFEQQSNTRKNVFVILNGEKLHLAEASRRLNFCPAKLSYRLRHGWSEAEALKP